jgi:DNA-binding transcriptional ArsR family regulator
MLITEVEQLKAISDPLRLRLVEAMAEDLERAWTAKDLAERLGAKQTKLYHHINLLEERGFLRVAETRLVSGIVEKRYALTARSFRVDRGLLVGGGGESAMSDVLDAIFDKARTEIMDAVHAGLIRMDEEEFERRRMALWMTRARLSPASVRKVMRQLKRLADIDDLEEDGGQSYGLVIAFYPRADEDTDR